jgi:hypothetical protein
MNGSLAASFFVLRMKVSDVDGWLTTLKGKATPSLEMVVTSRAKDVIMTGSFKQAGMRDGLSRTGSSWLVLLYQAILATPAAPDSAADHLPILRRCKRVFIANIISHSEAFNIAFNCRSSVQC